MVIHRAPSLLRLSVNHTSVWLLLYFLQPIGGSRGRALTQVGAEDIPRLLQLNSLREAAGRRTSPESARACRTQRPSCADGYRCESFTGYLLCFLLKDFKTGCAAADD
ncbi:hypothetical protein OJAV_G00003330 [Oryzias javanicus]|uniref:Secreted protein n=1 Tax=Oryzias javanicus TaxID=123683 RepID=A0A437DM42_ORYJA|nr:hypothetical protein OJAV_G00003330 [Oryzias javanicus]